MTWTTVALRDIGRWSGGGTPSKGRPEFWTEGTIPWLSPKDMRGEVLHDTKDHITPEAVVQSAARLVPSGSVAVVTRSGILERTLPVAYVPFETTLNQDLRAVVARPDVDPRWIAWGLRRYEREILATTRKAGTTVASIEVPRLMAFPLPVPRLQEQRRIVEILEEHLSHLDAATIGLQRAKVRSSRLWKAHITRRILPGTARQVLSGEPSALGGVAAPHHPLPLGWAWRQWSEIGHSQNGKAFPSSDYEDHGVRLLRPGNLHANGSLHWMARNTRSVSEVYRTTHASILLRPGDLVMNLTAQSLADDFLGRACMVGAGDESLLNQRLARLTASAVEPDYALAVFRSGLFRHYVKSLSTGSLIQHMFTKQVDRFWFPVAPLDVRTAIVAESHDIQSNVDRILASIILQHERVVGLRRAVLAAAFEGKLTGRHTDQEIIEETALGATS